eukprot:1176047-Prorocentrum_minimum.AAC.6
MKLAAEAAIVDLEENVASTENGSPPTAKSKPFLTVVLQIFPRLLQLLKSQFGDLFAWILDEVEPWAKWMLYDALFSVLIARLIRRWGKLEAVFSLLGWV